MTLAPDDPATLGRYRVLDRLGAGAIGRVLLGVDETGRRAALRIVHRELAADAGFRERFRREVRMASTAPPWFTAPVLDADPDAELPWLATAFVEGPSLQDYVSGQGPLGEQGTEALAVRMADGLVALHGAGLVHRDLTPSNVLLAQDGPRLIDFGLARAADGTALTRTGHLMGTPEYMSPEQASGAPEVGPAGDMFSFAALVAFAATGRSPFAADSTAGTLYRVVHSEPDPGPLSGPLREAVVRCLAKDPAARPTAEQVRDMLAGAPVTVGSAAVDPAQAPTVMTTTAPPTVIGAPVVPHHPGPAHHPGPTPTAAAHPPRRRWPTVLAIVLAAVAGAGIALAVVPLLSDRLGGGDTPVAGGPPATAPATAAPSTSGGLGPSDPAAGSTLIDAATDTRFGSGGARFATPSGNIACSMTTDEVRCDVLERTWQVPPAPAGCGLAYGGGAILSGTGAGELSCVGDTVADPGLATLAYGEAVQFGGVVCVSKETGLRCENPQTRHGFTVSRAAYELF